MYYTYILYSDSFDKFYIGQTIDISNRLSRHNNGSESATKPYIPWKMLWFANKSSRSEAILLEKKLKNLGKVRLIQFINKYSPDKP
ncbi:MAG: GIY-YIG nuclease family protein [Saprospiraceae bacterium]